MKNRSVPQSYWNIVKRITMKSVEIISVKRSWKCIFLMSGKPKSVQHSRELPIHVFAASGSCKNEQIICRISVTKDG